MKKEIGGYIELIDYKDGYEYYEYANFNSARNAFAFYALYYDVKKVYVPYYLCDSIINVCKKHKIDFEFYGIDRKLRPVFSKKILKNELLYIVNYFGTLTNEEILFLKNKYNQILVDNVQCFYTKPLENIPTIYSCRKFFGVPDGAYLSGFDNKNQFDLPQNSAKNRMKHLLGRKNGTASQFYRDFLKNEEFISKADFERMSFESQMILKKIDHKQIIECRNDNFDFLKTKLDSLNLLEVKKNNGPFCYPLLVKGGGEELRKYLIKNYIYIPIFWPNVVDEKRFAWETFLSKNLLPIPCDQRYSLEDVRYICDKIYEYESKKQKLN